jgi:NAD(P)-dependent dehydrogenase (short-subunit alcohol dehydrogenase family)
MTTTDLRGRTVAVTGGLGDIGSAICRRAAASGATVHVLDIRPPDEAAQALETLRGLSGADAGYHQVDVRDLAAVEEVFTGLPRLDAVVGNAGVGIMAHFLDMTEQIWHEQIDINLTGCFNTGLAAARRMRGHGGSIVFISSWIGTVPWPGMTAYCASKGGLDMLAKTMARDLAAHRIRVNVVAPGIVEAGPSLRIMRENADYLAATRRVIPMGRLQSTDEVAAAVSFLLSADAGYATGSVLTVDGGCSLFKFEEDKA